MTYQIIAGSGYGLRGATYEQIDGKLALVEADPSDGLTGNGVVEEFEGLTPDEAMDKVEFENAQNQQDLINHSYDGCHACNWKVTIRET